MLIKHPTLKVIILSLLICSCTLSKKGETITENKVIYKILFQDSQYYYALPSENILGTHKSFDLSKSDSVSFSLKIITPAYNPKTRGGYLGGPLSALDTITQYYHINHHNLSEQQIEDLVFTQRNSGVKYNRPNTESRNQFWKHCHHDSLYIMYTPLLKVEIKNIYNLEKGLYGHCDSFHQQILIKKKR